MSQLLQPLNLESLNLAINFTGFELKSQPDDGKYLTNVAASINRILTTRIGERVMRPKFGSSLYLLRDRAFNSEWRILATRYIYEAITKWEPRVNFKQLHFSVDASTGKTSFYLELEAKV